MDLLVDHDDLGSLPPVLLVVNEYDDLRVSGEALRGAARACGSNPRSTSRQNGPRQLGMTLLVPEVDATYELGPLRGRLQAHGTWETIRK